MRVLKFALSAVISLLVIFFLGKEIKVKNSSLPALGPFFSPESGFWQNAEAAELTPPSNLKLAGLTEEVKIVYDDRMIPHIFAKNTRDASMAQGYVVASHRLWQMEFYTRAAGGRLSEIIGDRVLGIDKRNRNMGIPYAAEVALEEWKKYPEHYQYLEAYSEGINAYIRGLKKGQFPIEYKLLGNEPEEWSPYKTALLQKMMAQMLASREYDMESSNALALLGTEEFNFLFPERYKEISPIVPRNTKFAKPKVNVEKGDFKNGTKGKTLSHKAYPKPTPHLGSNNWAVAGSKTKNGYPILCNDPHLNLTLPSIWYELQISTPEQNTYGVCLPGSPGIIIGFNDEIAWGVTNVGQDVTDWISIKWKDKQRKEYLYDGAYKPATYRVEEYKIKGQALPVTDTLFFTHWGPVAYSDKVTHENDLALRWMAHNPSNEMSVFYKLDKAKNYDEYQEAISGYTCPAQNFAFASKTGDIALWVQGRFPIKADQQGRFVSDGSLAETEWKGFIPREENPHYKNPERGFVSSANQHSTDETYPYYYNGGFADFRGRTINDKLSNMENVSVEDLMKLQNDNFNLSAKEFVPYALEKLNKSILDKDEIGYFNEIKNWDYIHDKTKVAPSVFRAWYREFYRQTWDEFYVFEDSLEVIFPEQWRTNFLLRDDPENRWFDSGSTEKVETASDIVTLSFKSACLELKTWSTGNNKQPLWRDYKGSKITHLTRIKAFSEHNIDIGGDKYAINAMSDTHGPSWRMIVELGEEVKGWGVYPGGQSGNPGSHHYTDGIEKWAKGEYYNLLRLASADDKNDRLIATQTLAP